jgi:adenosylmethionine-8-amino-7-oxononanoate aminotransferase
MGGTLDGVRGEHVLLAPPYIIEPPQIAEILDKLERAVRAAL